MKRKLKPNHIFLKFIITLVSISVIIIVLISFIYKLTNVRINKNEIIKFYYSYKSDFNNVKKELKNKSKISIERTDKNYMVLYDNKEYVLNENNFKTVYKLINEIDINYIEKIHSNMEINFNSQIGYSQGIVYINNMENFKYSHEIDIIEKIEDNWYYVEED